MKKGRRVKHLTAARRRALIGYARRRWGAGFGDWLKSGLRELTKWGKPIIKPMIQNTKIVRRLQDMGLPVDALVDSGIDLLHKRINTEIERRTDPLEPPSNPPLGTTDLTPAKIVDASDYDYDNYADWKHPDPPNAGAFIDSANYHGAGNSALNEESIAYD